MNDIEINLAEQGDAKSYEDTNIIQKDAKDELVRLIKKFKNDILETNKNIILNNGEIKRVHNTILVHGKRGAGKSTFAMNIMKYISENDRNITVLGIIDPTLIESKEHIFLNIISKIYEQVKKVKNTNNSNSYKFKDVERSLKKLARGLSLLDGVGSNNLESDLWDSPELILEEGLSNALQGSALEENFHNFIKESLSYLGAEKEAFLLVFDDIDTSADQGMKIMEVLRKYLTTNQLIVVLLGDIELYSTLIRQLQWKKLDPERIIKDYELETIQINSKNEQTLHNIDIYLNKALQRDKEYRKQINHLEEQYMVKILKPENRLELKSIYQLQQENKEIEILGLIKNSISEKLELSKALNNLSKDLLLITNTRIQKSINKLILSLPTRSVIQILQAYSEYIKTESSLTFSIKLKHIFYASLDILKPYYLLDNYDEKSLIQNLSLYLLNHRLGEFSFTPKLTEEKRDEDFRSIYLSSLSKSVLFGETNTQYLSFFIKIGYLHKVFISRNIKDKSIFIEHMHLNRDSTSTNMAERIISAFNITQGIHHKPLFFGSLFVKMPDIKKLTNINTLYLTMSSVSQQAGGKYNFISFFNLLGLISDLLQENPNKHDIEVFLNRNMVIQNVIMFDDVRDDSDQEGDEEIFEENNEAYFTEGSLLDDIVKWIEKSKNIDPISIELLFKIWDRVSNTFEDIGKYIDEENYFKILNRYCIGFLNAVYIETKDLTANKVVRNAIKEDKNFYDLIKDYKTGNEYDLFDVFFQCPIIKLFIKQDNPYSQSIYTELENLEFEQKVSFKTLKDTSRKEVINKVILDIKNNGEERHVGILDNYINISKDDIRIIYEAIKYRIQKQNYNNITRANVLPLVKEILTDS